MYISLQGFLQQTLQNDAVRWFFYGPLILILIDIWSGICAAIATRQFTFRKIGAFLDQDLLKYLVVSVLVAGIYLAGGEAQAIATASVLGMSVLALHIVASIWSNVCEGLGITAVSLGPLQKLLAPLTQRVVQAAEEPAIEPQLPLEKQPTGPVMIPVLSLPAQQKASFVEQAQKLSTPPVNYPDHL